MQNQHDGGEAAATGLTSQQRMLASMSALFGDFGSAEHPFTTHPLHSFSSAFSTIRTNGERAMSYAYRGEDGPSSSKPGRTPADVVKAGGFAPWRASSLDDARTNLMSLVQAGTLLTEAEKWCLQKDRINGWFFSTGLDEKTAYDNYQYFYRMDIGGLSKRDWSSITDKKVPGMDLYLNDSALDRATMIAVIWTARKKELLVMSPVSVDTIEIKPDPQKNVWVPLGDY